MSFPPDANLRKHPAAALIAAALLLAACTTSPTNGRTQFNLLPGQLDSTVSNLRFDVKTLLNASPDFCPDTGQDCVARAAAEDLSQRIAPIAEHLGLVTVQLSPELVTRVPRVEVYVVANDTPSISSSAGGKIAVSSGIARLELSDTDLALALAREYGRLASAHHRESASAGIAVSLITSSPLVGAYVATSFLADLLFPMGAVFKAGLSVLGSLGTEQLVEASQQDEADEFARRLMLAAGYDLRKLAETRPPDEIGTVRLGWLPNYFASRARIAGMAPAPANTEEAAPALLLATEMATVPETAMGVEKESVAGPLPDK